MLVERMIIDVIAEPIAVPNPIENNINLARALSNINFNLFVNC
jgi:hypothetical protein